jgi:ABC-type lipoprotein export system ATPase subunit
VDLAGRLVSGLRDREAAEVRRRLVGFVFQSFNLLSHLTALENVTLPSVSAGAALRARELLELFGVEDRSEHLPGQLSGGEQQRVALARALINQPGVILADEPTGNLDDESELLVLRHLRLLANKGAAVLVVSHDPAVATMADRCVELAAGRLVDSW